MCVRESVCIPNVISLLFLSLLLLLLLLLLSLLLLLLLVLLLLSLLLLLPATCAVLQPPFLAERYVSHLEEQ